jgi:hypothetical protein
MDPGTQTAAKRVIRRDHCGCLGPSMKHEVPRDMCLHADSQNRDVAGWSHTLGLVRLSAAQEAHVFEPSAHIPWDDWMQVVTLPEEVADLKTVQAVRLYGSHLRRLPPQIGRMVLLEELDIYTSYSLHWLPYEILRCSRLCKSRISTRALYGNKNTRLPFPQLSAPVEALLPPTCSVCDRPFGEVAPQLFWVTLRVATDVVPLLIHSCSHDCTLSVPAAPANYFERPHKGGAGVGMPAEWDPRRNIWWPEDVILKL